MNNVYPSLPDNASDSERLAAIRALFADFDWELDDRQYALEAIERYASSPIRSD